MSVFSTLLSNSLSMSILFHNISNFPRDGKNLFVFPHCYQIPYQCLFSFTISQISQEMERIYLYFLIVIQFLINVYSFSQYLKFPKRWKEFICISTLLSNSLSMSILFHNISNFPRDERGSFFLEYFGFFLRKECIYRLLSC
jgi:hypothetical protein